MRLFSVASRAPMTRDMGEVELSRGACDDQCSSRTNLRFAAAASLAPVLDLFFQRRTHANPGFLRELDFSFRLVEPAGLHADDGQIVVRLSELRVDFQRLAVFAF